MAVTRKNHYIPCFWSAYWNKDYYADNKSKTLKSRLQLLKYYNVLSDKLLVDKTENLFFSKNSNNVKISNSGTIDFEGFFTIKENQILDYLKGVIVKNKIDSFKEKVYLSMFFHDLKVNNYEFMADLESKFYQQGMNKLDMFYYLREVYSNPSEMKLMYYPFISSKWVVYTTERFLLPLSDKPFMICENIMIYVVSPKMIIKIFTKIKVDDIDFVENKKITTTIFIKYVFHVIKNSQRIIVHNNLMFLKLIKFLRKIIK